MTEKTFNFLTIKNFRPEKFQTALTYTHAQMSTCTRLQRKPTHKKGLLNPLRETAVDPLDVMDEFRAHLYEGVREILKYLQKYDRKFPQNGA